MLYKCEERERKKKKRKKQKKWAKGAVTGSVVCRECAEHAVPFVLPYCLSFVTCSHFSKLHHKTIFFACASHVLSLSLSLSNGALLRCWPISPSHVPSMEITAPIQLTLLPLFLSNLTQCPSTPIKLLCIIKLSLYKFKGMLCLCLYLVGHPKSSFFYQVLTFSSRSFDT